jgi:hypothetical protein
MEVQSATETLCANKKQDDETYAVYARLHIYTTYTGYFKKWSEIREVEVM